MSNDDERLSEIRKQQFRKKFLEAQDWSGRIDTDDDQRCAEHGIFRCLECPEHLEVWEATVPMPPRKQKLAPLQVLQFKASAILTELKQFRKNFLKSSHRHMQLTAERDRKLGFTVPPPADDAQIEAGASSWTLAILIVLGTLLFRIFFGGVDGTILIVLIGLVVFLWLYGHYVINR